MICVNTYIFLHECFWLTFKCVPLIDYPHKSHPDLGLDPSRFVVRFSRAYPRFSIPIPFSFGGLRDLRVQYQATDMMTYPLQSGMTKFTLPVFTTQSL
jgi:hypothetical protein